MNRARLRLTLFALALAVAGCADERRAEAGPAIRTASPPTETPSRLDSLLAPYGDLAQTREMRPLSTAQAWADSALASLTLDEKIGQLLVVDLNPSFLVGATSLEQVAEDWDVGGFHVPRRLDPRAVLRATNRLQERARVPLFFTADYEWGPGAPGTTLTQLPAAMAFGAAGDPVLAEAAGAISAMEARAMGVNVLLAPVADVNNNPRNPIINTRAYGDDPRAVGRMAAAFVRGAQAHGVYATLKHFPGHGNTGTDTHLAFDAVPGAWGDLALTELGPYRRALAERPGVVMTAHLWMRALDPTATPATFSRRALADVLRDSLGFGGLVMTDAIHMGALTSRYDFEDRILQPLHAGADLILNTYDPQRARRVIRDAVGDGRLTLARIDASVHRILVHKARLGLGGGRVRDEATLDRLLARPHGERVARAVAEESVTLVEPGPLPLARGARVALVQLGNLGAKEAEARFERDLREGGLDLRALPPTLDAAPRVDGLDAVVIGVHLQVFPAERPTLTREQSRVVDAILARGTPAVVVLFGNPYAALDLNGSSGLLMAYDGTARTASAVADVLLGRREARGRLPVDLPGRYRRGHAAALAP